MPKRELKTASEDKKSSLAGEVVPWVPERLPIFSPPPYFLDAPLATLDAPYFLDAPFATLDALEPRVGKWGNWENACVIRILEGGLPSQEISHLERFSASPLHKGIFKDQT